MAAQNKTNDKYVKCDDHALVFISAPSATDLPINPTLALNNSQITFVINEATAHLTIIAQYSDGAVKTADILLS